MGKAWFETWFNTKYYHLLYRNRNEVEARQFIDALLQFLHLEKGMRCIDIACGKGRHAKYLHSLGFNVTGIDLSELSIREANHGLDQIENIQFIQHDIRDPFPAANMHLAVNLFTSFGYFDSDIEHEAAIKNMHNCLKVGGFLVMDYMNTKEVIQQLRKDDFETIDKITFKVSREIVNDQIVKHIEVHDSNSILHFKEKVRAYSPECLQEMLITQGFEIFALFGNYSLHPLEQDSPRVIIVARRAS